MIITKFSINNKRHIISDILITLLIFFLIIVLLLNPVHYAKTFLDGLLLFSSSVLPGLFPFMLLTRILTKLNAVKILSKSLNKLMKKIFNSPGIAAYVLIMSNLSGYPIGAKIVGDLYTNQTINDDEAKKIISYSMTSGPVFVIGTVGALLLGNIRAGIIILISHLLSNLITGVIICKILKNKNKSTIIKHTQQENLEHIELDKILSDSMYSSVQSILVVGGFISIFYCFSEILFDTHIFDFLSFPISKIFNLIGLEPQISRGIMSGIVEVTRGIKELSVYFPTYPKLITSIACLLISFSGLSIIMQAKAFLTHTKIKTHFLILSKSVHAILSFIVCYFLCSILL